MEIKIQKQYKSISPIVFNLPNFCVLTGKNGSGKSHLLQAMADKSYSSIFESQEDSEDELTIIKYIPFNGLNPNVQSDCQYLSLTQARKNEWNKIHSAILQYNQNIEQNKRFGRTAFSFLPRNESQIHSMLKKLIKRCGSIDTINEDEFNALYEVSEMSSSEIFTSQFASIFKLYHTRLEDNQYKVFRNEKYGDKYAVLSDEQFAETYGPKPWDLINSMLEKASLSYRVNNPEGQDREADFHLTLTDPERGININVNDLSTGEKVLMSLALAIYNTTEHNHKPHVLLLDEPDAPLHPEYSKVLLSAIYESIVIHANVKVVITTHNPTTVALAQEDSLFKMDRDLGVPVKITKKQAINMLTKDLDNFRISTDPRRQIFVENQNDVQYYERIVRILPEFKVKFQFLSPHTRNGCNCDDVKRIVHTLREFGNDSVYGLVDYDNTNKSDEFVYVVGEQRRYAIDNYIFDPIYVFFLLVREGVVKTEEVGIGNFTFTKLGQLNNDQLQNVIDYITNELGFNKDKTENYHTIDGRTFIVANEYFKIQGHELESKIMQKWPQLNAIKKGKNDEWILKIHVLDKIINEYPEFISADFVDTFNRIS
ncbi:MAG: ATP-binding protein [Muribaculaceae bacterium]